MKKPHFPIHYYKGALLSSVSARPSALAGEKSSQMGVVRNAKLRNSVIDENARCLECSFRSRGSLREALRAFAIVRMHCVSLTDGFQVGRALRASRYGESADWERLAGTSALHSCSAPCRGLGARVLFLVREFAVESGEADLESLRSFFLVAACEVQNLLEVVLFLAPQECLEGQGLE